MVQAVRRLASQAVPADAALLFSIASQAHRCMDTNRGSDLCCMATAKAGRAGPGRAGPGRHIYEVRY